MIDEEIWGAGERAARDAVTGETYYVPGDMTYEEWKAKQDALHGAGTVDRERKKAYNENKDRGQWERYQKALGKNAPKTFAEFQTIKYSEGWNAFKEYAKSIKSGELTPLADFNLYKSVSEEIDATLVGIETKNGLLITGKTYHFIPRVIGSMEQRRSGVQVSDILDALINSESEIHPIKEKKNGRSQKFRNQTVEVTVNPDTGTMIQANPIHSKKKVKS